MVTKKRFKVVKTPNEGAWKETAKHYPYMVQETLESGVKLSTGTYKLKKDALKAVEYWNKYYN